MISPSLPTPSRILRIGISALFLAVVCFWAGRTFEGFAGFGFTMAALGCGSVGLGLVIAEAMEHLTHPERLGPRTSVRRRADTSMQAVTLGRCGICHQRRVQRSTLVVCPTCDRHLTV
ncbi:MAG: hypothetical protein WCC01_01040 [Acidimicrobiia bacterium]